MPEEKRIVINNNAVIGWAFMSIWMAMLCAFSWLAIRDGGIPGHSGEFAGLVFGLFWVAGVVVSIHMLGIPRIRAVARPEGLVIEEIWLWKRRSVTLERGAAQQLRVVDGKDDDGDPYFKCEARLPGGTVVILKKSHTREIVEAAHRSLVAALAG